MFQAIYKKNRSTISFVICQPIIFLKTSEILEKTYQSKKFLVPL